MVQQQDAATAVCGPDESSVALLTGMASDLGCTASESVLGNGVRLRQAVTQG